MDDIKAILSTTQDRSANDRNCSRFDCSLEQVFLSFAAWALVPPMAKASEWL